MGIGGVLRLSTWIRRVGCFHNLKLKRMILYREMRKNGAKTQAFFAPFEQLTRVIQRQGQLQQALQPVQDQSLHGS